ncbi:MAG: hypothetical protein MUF36_12540 [Bacteroidales bacterium]|nr:hypothetical protein [Bacteroidales bacterium]
MKKSLLRYKFLVLLIIMITSVTHAQLVLYEGFDYSLPGYIGGNTGSTGSSSNNWITHSLTAGQTTTIDLYSGSLNYLGSQNPIGNKILLPGSNTTVTRDVNRAITTSSTAIYYSALVNILDNTQLGTSGDYFMAVGQTAGSSVTVLGARLGVKSVNAGANYRLLIMNTSGGSPTYTEFALDLNFGTTYLVVVKYDRSVSYTNATLWVNPTSELSTSVSNNSGSGTFTAFLSICLRNSSGTPKAEIDEIRVGESFASVTPVDVAAPVASFNPSNGTIGVAIDATPKIYFDEPILKTDGSAITDGDLPSLLNFRKTDAGGDAVACKKNNYCYPLRIIIKRAGLLSVSRTG